MGHRELPASEDPQESDVSISLAASFTPSEQESSDSDPAAEDPQSDPAAFSFSFALDRLHSSMRERALLTSLERT